MRKVGAEYLAVIHNSSLWKNAVIFTGTHIELAELLAKQLQRNLSNILMYFLWPVCHLEMNEKREPKTCVSFCCVGFSMFICPQWHEAVKQKWKAWKKRRFADTGSFSCNLWSPRQHWRLLWSLSHVCIASKLKNIFLKICLSGCWVLLSSSLLLTVVGRQTSAPGCILVDGHISPSTQTVRKILCKECTFLLQMRNRPKSMASFALTVTVYRSRQVRNLVGFCWGWSDKEAIPPSMEAMVLLKLPIWTVLEPLPSCQLPSVKVLSGTVNFLCRGSYDAVF